MANPIPRKFLNAGNTAVAISAGASTLYSYSIVNPNSYPIYVKFYDKTAGSVNPRSDTPAHTVTVAGGATAANETIEWAFATACAVRCVTGATNENTNGPAVSPDLEVDLAAAGEGAGTVAERGITNEIYLAVRTDGQTGMGTSNDPFDASTSALLDAILLARSAQTYLTIYFKPGVFLTKGNTVWFANSGWKFKGAGLDVSILRLDPTAVPPSHGSITVIGSLNTIAGYCSVEDMTVDANATHITGPQANSDNDYKLTPVGLYGDFNTFKNLRVTGSDSSQVNGLESFDLSTEGHFAGVDKPPIHNLAFNCYADSPNGDYSTGIAMGLPNNGLKANVGKGNTIQHCRATGYVDSHGVGGVGLNADVIIDSTSDGCNFGSRWEPTTNVRLEGCRFLNCQYAGVRIQDASGVNNLLIKDTLIELSKASPFSFTFLVWIDPTAGASNIVLDNVTGKVTGSGTTAANAFKINQGLTGQNVTVKNCTIDPYIQQGGTDLASDTQIALVRTPAGAAITNLADSLRPTNLGDLNTALTFSNKRINPRTSSTTPSLPAITPNGDTDDSRQQFNSHAAGTLTINAPTGTPVDGQKLELYIEATVGDQTLSWNAIYRSLANIPLPQIVPLNKYLQASFRYNSTDSKWDLMSVSGYIYGAQIVAAGRSPGVVNALVSSVCSFTPAADGSFEVSANILQTASGLSTAVNPQVTFNDENNTARTQNLPIINVGSNTISFVTTNDTHCYLGLPIQIRVKGGSTITIKTAGTVTSTTYNVEGIIRQLQS